MTFIKIGNTIINTDYIAAVDLNPISRGGKCSVVVQVAVAGDLFKSKLKEFRFKGETAHKGISLFQ